MTSLDKEKIIELIKRCFSKEYLFDLKLKDALVFDNWGYEVDFEEVSWDSWLDITIDNLENASCLFIHFAPLNAKYFLPAYMIWILRDLDKDLKSSSVCGNMCFNFLMDHKKNNYKELDLTSCERHCIDLVLKVIEMEDPFEYM